MISKIDNTIFRHTAYSNEGQQRSALLDRLGIATSKKVESVSKSRNKIDQDVNKKIREDYGYDMLT